jgi:hypothetical protein
MNSENWRKAEELLIAALEMPPENRRKFIAGISADELRREVESLLEVEAEAENFLGQPALAFSAEFFEAEETLTDQSEAIKLSVN